MSDDIKIGTREEAVRFPQILSVGPYIANKFPQTVPDIRDKTIYHYTTSQGLLGILKNESIWASNYAFLNDPSEKQHCLRKTEEAIAIVSKDKNYLINKFFDKILKILHEEGIWTEYIASFCEEGDLLSQWRSYASNASGYSIAFDAERLFGNMVQTAPLNKVIYDHKLQLDILTEICEIISEFFENEYKEKDIVFDNETDLIARQCANPIWSLCCNMKHESYSEEKEWRLVFLKSGIEKDENAIFDEEVRFRSRESAIIPYVNIPFGEARNIQNDQEHYPIQHVIIGPTENSDVSKKGVELFCASLNRGIDVFPSVIPNRKF